MSSTKTLINWITNNLAWSRPKDDEKLLNNVIRWIPTPKKGRQKNRGFEV